MFIACGITIVCICITTLIYIILTKRKTKKYTNMLIEQAKDEIERIKEMEESK